MNLQPHSAEELLTIGEVVRRTGKAASTIRYYEEIGLVNPPERISGRRRYPREIVRELAIMVARRETSYNLEWNAHETTAIRNGVDAKLIEIIRRRAPLAGVDEKDAAVIRLGRELFGRRKVDASTFAKIVEIYGKRGAMDMVAVMNTYAVSGFFAIAVDEQAAPDKSPL